MRIHDWTQVNAGIFHHFHHAWTTELAKALNHGVLPKGFFALAEQVAGGPIPDVLTLQRRPPRDPSGEATGALAIAESPPQTRFVHRAEAEQYARRAYRLAIHHPLGEVVAVLEIVSPGNKQSRAALRDFVTQAVDFLYHGIHLLIVDLFPPTSRDPQGIHKAIWDEIEDDSFELPADKRLTAVSYFAGDTKTAYIEPLRSGESLPDMPLFIDSHRYVRAPLQAAYDAAWEGCPDELRELLEQPSA